MVRFQEVKRICWQILLSVDRALERILERVHRLSDESIPLEGVLNRVLARDVVAKENIPPFANSSMDGFALRSADISSATSCISSSVTGRHGYSCWKSAKGPIGAGEAARIMTGAPMPEDADAVIPVESTNVYMESGDTNPLPAMVKVNRSLNTGIMCARAGEDIQIRATHSEAGTIIGPAEIGVLASLGYANVSVFANHE